MIETEKIINGLIEKIQTIYIDPPFNLDKNANYLYIVNYKDSNWATMLDNRLKITKGVLDRKTGCIFVRCDDNGNWIVRYLMNDIFGQFNFRNEIDIKRNRALPKTGDVNLIEEHNPKIIIETHSSDLKRQVQEFLGRLGYDLIYTGRTTTGKGWMDEVTNLFSYKGGKVSHDT
jgi:adenine specific DNA methylase Mod